MPPRKLKQVYPPDWATWEWPLATVLSFDQSLANTGWALIQFNPKRQQPKVQMHGTLHTTPDDDITGMRGSLVRGGQLVQDIANVMTIARASWHIDYIVHEHPAMMGMAKSRNQEAAPIAGLAVHAAVVLNQSFEIRKTPIVIMEIQRWKRWVTGNHQADKPQIAAALWRVIPQFGTNEHVRDAIGVAIGAACDGRLTSKLASDRIA